MKGKFFKWLIPLSMGIVMIGGVSNATNFVSAKIETSQIQLQTNAHTKVTIENKSLDTALRTLLGKSAQDNFYADDFMTNDNYKPTTVTDPDTLIETTTALNYSLDLSGTGVTDIRELVKFQWPSTLQGVNLSNNNLTNDNLASINEFLNLTIDSTLILGETTYTSLSDFSGIVKKVNLNGNALDISTIDSMYLENEKLIFGIQGLNKIDASTFVKTGEITPMYYIRHSDESYLTFSFYYDECTNSEGKLNLVYGTPTNLFDYCQNNYNSSYGWYNLTVSSVPLSETAYFNNYNYCRGFTLFNLELDSSFVVEKMSLFDLKVSSDGEILQDSPLKLEGFGNNSSVNISYANASTNHITSEHYKNHVIITLEKDGNSRVVVLEFVVRDTISPVIVLNGSNYVCSRVNRDYVELGFTAYDPHSVGSNVGEDLTGHVVKVSTVDITTVGTYTITYTVTDEAGNTTSVVRTVEIQESVLDTITLTSEDTKYSSGEDIILLVQPNSGIDLNDYEDLTYYWYMNDMLFQTTQPLDYISGKGTVTIVANKEDMVISVKLVGTQKSTGAEITLFSEDLNLEIGGLSENYLLIIEVGVVIVGILLIVLIVTIIKHKKAKGRTHGKHKNFHKGKKTSETIEDANNGIKVIKDFKADINKSNVNVIQDINMTGSTFGEVYKASTPPQDLTNTQPQSQMNNPQNSVGTQAPKQNPFATNVSKDNPFANRPQQNTGNPFEVKENKQILGSIFDSAPQPRNQNQNSSQSANNSKPANNSTTSSSQSTNNPFARNPFEDSLRKNPFENPANPNKPNNSGNGGGNPFDW